MDPLNLPVLTPAIQAHSKPYFAYYRESKSIRL